MIPTRNSRMTKRLLPLILLALFACEDDPIELPYSYKISWEFYTNDTFQDGAVYYYSEEDKLLRVDKYYGSVAYSPSEVIYQANYIDCSGGRYFLDPQSRVAAIATGGSLMEMEYDAEQLISKRWTINGLLHQENFYQYEDGNVVKDSIVIYEQSGGPAVTVHSYEYADTLAPAFMVDYSGLKEFPRKSKHLMKESTAPGTVYQYSYDIKETELTQVIELFDTVNGALILTMTNKYKLEHR